jgi:hypothetical protein
MRIVWPARLKVKTLSSRSLKGGLAGGPHGLSQAGTVKATS